MPGSSSPRYDPGIRHCNIYPETHRKMTPRAYMNSRELASHFHVSRAKVREWVGAGCPCLNPALKSQHAFRQQLIFKVADVEMWLKGFTQPEPTITQLELNFH